MQSLAERLHDALPQTQCTRCGYPDCAGYAQAIAAELVSINQCPPGGAQGIARLAAITGQAPLALNPAYGIEAPRQVAFVDEHWCIGCTLCISACPTDAIVGSHKLMHTVIEAHCTGCELCIPVCPVDCIVLEPASGEQTGWSAWSAAQADHAKARYAVHRIRVDSTELAPSPTAEDAATSACPTLPNEPAALAVQPKDPAAARRAAVQAAMAAARARRSAPPTA